MLRVSVRTLGVLLGLHAFALAAGGASAAPNRSFMQPNGLSQIKHVIVVVMENRTFDNLLNGFPGADTAQYGKTHDGKTVALQPMGWYGACDPDHSHEAWQKDYDGGKMDGFDTTPASCVGPTAAPTYPYSYLPESDVQPDWDLALEFSVADRMFASQSGPSYPGHLYLIAGASHNETDDPNALEWGCDAPQGTTVPVLGPDGNIDGSEFPCINIPTLGNRFDSANIPWAYYSNNIDYYLTHKKTELSTVPYDAIQNIREGPDWSNDMIGGANAEIEDIILGRLRPLSWFNPPVIASDHPQDTTNFGPDFVGTIANLVGESQYWNDTVILVTWDDHGGWYDHVPPPQLDRNGLGFRVPLIIVSRFAKRGYVSHQQHEFGSILKFIEQVFHVPSLRSTDQRADNLHDMFDFSVRNTSKPFVPVQTSVDAQFFEGLPLDTQPLDY